MKIGNIKFDNPVFLAPMAGITDLPFRLLCREFGAGLVYSEMVSAKGILYNNANTKSMLEVHEHERPAAIQLFGSEPEVLGKIASELDTYPFDIIDINMGCPAPKIVRNGEGSALMKNPKLIGEIVKTVSSATSKPVTIKIRKGFNYNDINAVEIAKIAEENGAKAIAIHGRTREEYYSGKADWEIIARVKENVSIPVIGNGDITSPEKAKEMFLQTNCDAIMIGRATNGNPWIFKEITHYLKTNEILPKPTLDEKIKLAIRHAEMLVDFKGEHIGVLEMRKQLCWYIKGYKGASEFKVALCSVCTLDEIVEVMARFRERTESLSSDRVVI